jgi:hypothetical protein
VRNRLSAPLALLLLLLPLGAYTEVPVRSEQLIWTIIAFNGREYAPTFAPETSDTIYLLAGVDNILSARETLVYWWPITAEWKTDTDSLNVLLPGTLEVRADDGTRRSLQLQPYTYFNVRGEYAQNWRVAAGDAARQEMKKLAALNAAYFRALHDYELKNAAYEEEQKSLAARIQRLRQENRNASALLQRMTALQAPIAPARPDAYVVPPSDLQQGFVLNLSPGRYTIRLVDPSGNVWEGSEKTVIAHGRSRSGRVGFEVIPGDKWTRPVESHTPASVFYVNGKSGLYLRPFFEDEFNALAYEKTVNNAARGNPSLQEWVRIQQVPHATLLVKGPGGEDARVAEQAFSVVQTQGNALGYTIEPRVADDARKDKPPDIVAFKVPIDGSARAIRVRLVDAAGKPFADGERQLRIIGPLKGAGALLALALSPLLAMIVVLVLRARRTRANGRAA